MSAEWVRTRALYDRLDALEVSVWGMADKLFPWLKSGRLKATALNVSEGAPGEEIPVEVWRQAVPEGLELGDDRLSVYHGSPRPTYEATGLAFDLGGIVEIFDLSASEAEFLKTGEQNPRLDASTKQSEPRKAGGRPKDMTRWEQFAAGLAFVAALDGQEFASRGELYTRVSDALARQGFEPLDESSVRGLLDMFLEWRDPEKPRPVT